MLSIHFFWVFFSVWFPRFAYTGAEAIRLLVVCMYSTMLLCYIKCSSTQNTCTRLVQIASRDINKYALLSGNIEVITVLLFKWFLFKFRILVLRYNKTNIIQIVTVSLDFPSRATFYEHLTMMTSMPVTICITLFTTMCLRHARQLVKIRAARTTTSRAWVLTPSQRSLTTRPSFTTSRCPRLRKWLTGRPSTSSTPVDNTCTQPFNSVSF